MEKQHQNQGHMRPVTAGGHKPKDNTTTPRKVTQKQTLKK